MNRTIEQELALMNERIAALASPEGIRHRVGNVFGREIYVGTKPTISATNQEELKAVIGHAGDIVLSYSDFANLARSVPKTYFALPQAGEPSEGGHV